MFYFNGPLHCLECILKKISGLKKLVYITMELIIQLYAQLR